MKKLLIILTLLTAVGLLFINRYQNEIKNSDMVTLYGNVEIRQVNLGFRVAGRIQNMYYEEGDMVKSGDLLAALDDIPYKTAFDQTVAEIAQNQAAYNNSVSKYNRNTPLCAKNIVSKQECDDLLNTMNGAKAALDAAIAANRHALNNLEDTKIYAPTPGMIMTRVQEPGAVVAASQTVYILSKDTPLWIRTYISEARLADIKNGMKAEIITDGTNPATGEKRRYSGYIGYISPTAEFTPKTVETTDLRTDLVYRLRIYVDNADQYLKQGMPATVIIKIPTAETAANG